MDSWQRFDETSLPDKEVFYSNLNMEDITDADYKHGKTLFEYLINKNLGDYMFKVIHYCLQMFLKILETRILKYMNLILLIFYLHLDWHSKLVQRKQSLN